MTKTNKYYMVMINHQGEGAVPEYFNTLEEAQEFYDNNSYVDTPEEVLANADAAMEIDSKISMREMLESK